MGVNSYNGYNGADCIVGSLQLGANTNYQLIIQ